MAKEIYKREDAEENLFRECLLKYHSIESCRSTGKIDMEYHIDLYLGNGLSVDVKSQKRINRSDMEPSDKYTWIELRNSSGRRGWLYGRATHIAFAMGNHYLMVERRHLVDYTEKVLRSMKLIDGQTQKYIITEKGKGFAPYKIYSKNGHDKIMMVRVKDLRGLNHVMVVRDAG